METERRVCGCCVGHACMHVQCSVHQARVCAVHAYAHSTRAVCGHGRACAHTQTHLLCHGDARRPPLLPACLPTNTAAVLLLPLLLLLRPLVLQLQGGTSTAGGGLGAGWLLLALLLQPLLQAALLPLKGPLRACMAALLDCLQTN